MPRARMRDASSWAAYRAKLEQTNVTGLASLADYEATHRGEGRRRRDWIVAVTPVFCAISIREGPLSGLATLGMHPPGERLPKEQVEALEYMAEVVHATGAQILEMRDSDDPKAMDFTVRGRIELAIWYLALGGREGMAVRELAWERVGVAVASIAQSPPTQPQQRDDQGGVWRVPPVAGQVASSNTGQAYNQQRRSTPQPRERGPDPMDLLRSHRGAAPRRRGLRNPVKSGQAWSVAPPRET
jgi:hypothetical protein